MNDLGGSSSMDDNDTNFITQQNFINNKSQTQQFGNQNNSKQNNFSSTQKRTNNENETTVTIKKKTVKKTTKMKESKNPKASMWAGDSFTSENMDPEMIELKKKDKILKMIKNSHIEKLKNSIFLKEINNAYYEMVRLSQMGDIAESKEMERTLLNLHASVIQDNIDAFSKTKMAKTHADFARTVGSTFFNSKTQRADDRRKIYNTTYTTTMKKVVNRNRNNQEDEIEEEENEENEEEEEKRIKKTTKNKNNKKNKNKISQSQRYNNRERDDNDNDNNDYEENRDKDEERYQQYPNQDNNGKSQDPRGQRQASQPIENPNRRDSRKPNVQDSVQLNPMDMQQQQNPQIQYNPQNPPINQRGDGERPNNPNPRRHEQYQYQYQYQVQDDKIEEGPNNPKLSGDIHDSRDDKKNPSKHFSEEGVDDDNNYYGDDNLDEDRKIDSEEQEPEPEQEQDQDIQGGQPRQYRSMIQQQEEVDYIKINSQSGKPYDPNISNKPGPVPVQEIQERILRNPPPKAGPSTTPKLPEVREEPTQTDEDYMNPSQIPSQSQQTGVFPSFPPDQNPQSDNPNQTYPVSNPNAYPNLPLKPPQSYPKGQIPPNSRQYPRGGQPGEQMPYYPPQRQTGKPHQPNRTRKPKGRPSPNYHRPYPTNPNDRNPRDAPQRQRQGQAPRPYTQGPGGKKKRPQSSTRPIISPYSQPYNPNPSFYPSGVEYERPRLGRAGSSSLSRSRSGSKSLRKSRAELLFAYPTKGKCFACDVNCSISRSGNSPNKYVPYMGSFKEPRKDITYYDGEKYGYYQYKSRFED